MDFKENANLPEMRSGLSKRNVSRKIPAAHSGLRREEKA